ncbi:glycosyltransferase family 2 protein [Patescibacteria group bacterium]|nr:MAG: glycosyltransferase family 2 protein [Patescibacteria group bacterium]
MDAAAIVPAYNEEATVGEVVRTLAASGEFREVVVISDGSTDRTAERARIAGATTVHELPQKGGKGSAILHGLRHTTSLIIFFADADLRGFGVEHIRALLGPVKRGELVMAVGLRDRGALTILQRYLPLIGGERALRREVVEGISPEHLQGFKIEQALNFHCRAKKWKYDGVVLPGLKIKTKLEKVGASRALGQYLKMYWEVLYAMLSVRWFHRRGQFLK